MNRALQPEIHPDPGLHPDVESLSAFMEQALPQPERARILDHIAACSRCRQVVFLSQQGVEAAPAAVPASRPNSRLAHWRLNWRVAWAPAVALAMVVVLTVFIHLRRPTGQTEMARVSPPGQGSTAGQQASPASSPRQPATEGTAPQSSPVPARNARRRSAPSVVVGQPAGEIVLPPESSGVIAAESVSASPAYPEAPRAAMAPGSSAQATPPANTVAESKPEPAVAAWQQEQQRVRGALESAARATRTTAARFQAKKAPSQPDGGLAAAPAAAPGIETRSALVGSFDASPPRAMAGAAAASGAAVMKLPSGLAAVSVATTAHRMVAIDQTGALFVRESSAANWEPVLRQWTGRVVLVRLQRPYDAGGAANAPAPSSSGGTFEILNDSNQVWVSQDGRLWKPQ